MSEAMVMCASSPDKVEILDPPPGCTPGERVTCPGFTGEGRGCCYHGNSGSSPDSQYFTIDATCFDTSNYDLHPPQVPLINN